MSFKFCLTITIQFQEILILSIISRTHRAPKYTNSRTQRAPKYTNSRTQQAPKYTNKVELFEVRDFLYQK